VSCAAVGKANAENLRSPVEFSTDGDLSSAD
jgi:hypothetical protein